MIINSENTKSTYMERNHTYHEMNVTKEWMNRVKYSKLVINGTHVSNLSLK